MSGCSGERRRAGAWAADSWASARQKARRYDQETDAKVTFDDVAGIDEAENELVEIVDFLKDPPKYTPGRHGSEERAAGRPARNRRRPLARAVAGEAGVPFFSMSGSEFVEMIVGVGAARVRTSSSRRASRHPRSFSLTSWTPSGALEGNCDRGLERAGADLEPDPERDGRFSSREGIIVLAATPTGRA